MVTLIVSDVIGDPLDAIASGPTAADPTTFADALAVLRKFDLGEKVPDSVLAHLKAGASGKHPETPNRLPKRVDNVILANNRTALDAAAREARRLGYKVVDLGSRLEGESRELGHMLAGLVRGVRAEGRPASPPVCILSGGETTVTLKGKPGKGGGTRNWCCRPWSGWGASSRGRSCSAAARMARTVPPTPPVPLPTNGWPSEPNARRWWRGSIWSGTTRIRSSARRAGSS